MSDRSPIQLGSVTIDLCSGRLVNGEQVTELTPLEINLLDYLAQRPGQVVSRDTLLVEVWKYAPGVHSRAPHHTVTRLREKLGPAASMLTSVRGRGYRLEGVAESTQHLVGRAQDLQDLQGTLTAPGCVVLYGRGGVGKTRLAMSAAQASGARLVPYPADGPSALGAAASLGRALIVLDGADAPGACAAVLDWMADAPELTVLLTCRADPGLTATRCLRLSGLSREAATALFCARTGLTPTAEVEHIVDALEGLPLAIELAAHRARILSLNVLTARMSERLSLLQRPEADVARHTSLRACILWSWGHLPTTQQRTLAALSVFVDDFSVSSACAVLERDVLDALEGLLKWCLIERDGTRLRLPDSVRAFAQEQLSKSEQARLQQAHAVHFAALSTPETDRVLLRSAAVRERIQPEAENLLAACTWALSSDKPGLAACAWQARSLLAPIQVINDEVLSEAILSHPDLTAPARARLLCARAEQRRVSGHLSGAIQDARQSLSLLETLQDQWRTARASLTLGSALNQSGDLDAAADSYRDALAIFTAVHDRQRAAITMSNLAIVTGDRGNIPAAIRLFEDTLVICQDVGDRLLEAAVFCNLAMLYKTMGERVRVKSHLRHAMRLLREEGEHRTLLVAMSLLANSHNEWDELEAAVALYSEAIALAREQENRREEAILLGNLAEAHHKQGDLDTAYARNEEASWLARRSGDTVTEGVVTSRMGLLCGLLGEDRAQALLAQAEALLTASGDVVQLGAHFCRAAEVAGADQPDEAQRLLACAREQLQKSGLGPESPLGSEIARLTTPLSP